jgi:hypothetical protein
MTSCAAHIFNRELELDAATMFTDSASSRLSLRRKQTWCEDKLRHVGTALQPFHYVRGLVRYGNITRVTCRSVRVCARARVCVRVCVCVCERMRAHASVRLLRRVATKLPQHVIRCYSLGVGLVWSSSQHLHSARNV